MHFLGFDNGVGQKSAGWDPRENFSTDFSDPFIVTV